MAMTLAPAMATQAVRLLETRLFMDEIPSDDLLFGLTDCSARAANYADESDFSGFSQAVFASATNRSFNTVAAKLQKLPSGQFAPPSRGLPSAPKNSKLLPNATAWAGESDRMIKRYLTVRSAPKFKINAEAGAVIMMRASRVAAP
ncbi:hypothetical protein [Mycolicibacterium sp. HK-90]|uniref:hypothetical protein n=1 Tax=Mycolicibacterium sp. HK-90 TaxID=3056937 RepID=UPI00265B3797|nr:hypothetical protein [Mycolicibacterium sp. HK-90]WKG04419.1 hypothetical protein QU592_04705 [Mycolicibacterium sp. HK-90]